jgi:hypothetical protein
VIRTVDYLVGLVTYWIPEHQSAVNAGQWQKAAALLEDAIHREPADVRQFKDLSLFYSQVHAQLARDLAKTGDASGAKRQLQIAQDLAQTSRRL